MAAVGLRERKKSETRASLRSAALELSLDRGPDAVTVEQICEHADVSRRTFFNYFASKDEAIVGWSDEQLAQVSDAVTARPDGEPDAAAVVSVAAAILEASSASPLWRAQLDLVRQYPEIAPRLLAGMQRVEGALAAGLAARTNSPDPTTCRLLAAVTGAVMRVAVNTWRSATQGPDPAELFRVLFARLEGSPLVAAVPADPTPTDTTPADTDTTGGIR